VDQHIQPPEALERRRPDRIDLPALPQIQRQDRRVATASSRPHRHGRIVTAASSPAISLAKLFRS
jgi:hypothetical protein